MKRKAKSCVWRGICNGGLTSPFASNLSTPPDLGWLRCHPLTRAQVLVYSPNDDVVSIPFRLLPRCPASATVEGSASALPACCLHDPPFGRVARPRRPHSPVAARATGSPHLAYCVTRHRAGWWWCVPSVRTNGGAGSGSGSQPFPSSAVVALTVGVRLLAGDDPCGQLGGELQTGNIGWPCGGLPLFNNAPVRLWHRERVILVGVNASISHASCAFWRACGNGTRVLLVANCCGRSE